MVHAQLGRIAPRDRGTAFFRHCEEQSDEAIQLFQIPQRKLDCFASLAMTVILAV
jgi:hypothetical protein